MKLLSVVVPSYNSQDYMSKAIESLLIDPQRVEILIVNDGSSDATAEIAQKYAAQFPQTVKAIDQENKGHGGAVTTGIYAASGLFVKVVDSDDWLEETAFRRVLEELEQLKDNPPDMIVANFVYEKEGKKHKKVMSYEGILPEKQVFGWEAISHLKKGKYLLMHSLIYRRELLIEQAFSLPEHTFYVDNLFAYFPMMGVETIYYINVDLYRYYIGREGQSVAEKIMIKRIDQQIFVNKTMFLGYDEQKMRYKFQRDYLFNYLEIVTMISTSLLTKFDTPENLQKKEELYQFFKENNFPLYQRIKKGLMGRVLNLQKKPGRKVSVFAYQVAQKIVGFN